MQSSIRRKTMEIEERQFLMPGDNITLKRVNIKTGKTLIKDSNDFSIISVIGEGGSSICYEACCESDGSHGRLKEFYPKEFSEEKQFFALERNGENQLIIPNVLSSAQENFFMAKEEFKEAYCTLAKAKNKSYGEVLNNYIPTFELYEGTPNGENQPKTIYVWTRHDKKIKHFNEYLNDMKADIEAAKQPEHHLFNILTAILTLTKCVSALHTSDLVHMDIKPSNFGVSIDSNGQIDASNISLFDINTIYSTYSTFIRTAGTVGFRAPETLKGKASSKSDIYSIGATLFNAIVVFDDFDGLYRDEYYDEIDNYITNSKLIKCSDKNSNSALHDILVKILKTCLAYKPDKRYKGCSYLAEDIKNARAFMLPEEAKSVLTELGQDIKIVNVEEYLDKEISSGATGAIQRLLFEHPLYENNGENIDVLVLGAGTYAQKFIDIAFEVAQVENCTLRITAVSNNVKADKKRYLKSRPAFTKFFTVDGISPVGEPFGYLDFMPVDKDDANVKFTREDQTANKEIINKLILSNEDRKYSYIFIALGDDELNYCVAEECLLCNSLPEYKSQVYFAWYGAQREFAKASPVYVNNVISESDYYRDLKRMALNCHLLWNNSLNVDIQKIKGDFSIPYNFNSSFSNILSIKYKLHSVGIDNMNNHFDAAKRFEQICRENKSAINSLIKYEHRRWIVNYICQGWNSLTDYTVLTVDTKDKKNKLHPCIVRSDSKWTLNMPEWKNNGNAKWDTASKSELAELDELDRVSIELHRYFKNKAESVKSLASIQSDIDKISNSLKFHPDALKVFDRFVLCLTEIIEGRNRQTSLYTYYSKSFKEQLKKLPKDISSELEKKIKIIENMFYPILQSQKYTDYKEFDCKLVKGIPFILTYSTSIRLCVPFGIEAKGDFNNRLLFGNVASSLMLNPSVITYVIDTEDVVMNKAKFMRSLTYAMNCIQNRRMQAKVNLLFLQPSGTQVVDIKLKEEIKEVSKRIGNIEIIEYESDTQLKEQLLEYIKVNQKNKKKCFSAIEKNATGISKLMRGLGCYEAAPAFRYDSVKGKFETDSRCEYLKHVKSNDYLRVSDMFEFQAAESSSVLPEMQLDYNFFWKLYKSPNPKDSKQQNEKVWKKLCGKLKDIADMNDLILSINVPKNDEKTLSTAEERTYYIPVFCRDAIEKILYELKEISNGFTGGEPIVTYHNSSTCKVTLKTIPIVYEKLDELLSNPYVLHDASKIRVEKFNKFANIYFDNLKVEKLKKSVLTSALSEQGFADRLVNVLKELNDRKYIINYRETAVNGDTFISFTYSSPQIKSLMVNEGRILELYVYYKALEQNYFDDIANSCEIIWNKDNVSNEFDVVLTKGYKALLVECKARNQLEQDFYYKLAQLNQRFGINAIPVLVADTIELPWYDNSINEKQRSRGNELGIKTIYKGEEITEKAPGTGIGVTLRKIMENFK